MKRKLTKSPNNVVLAGSLAGIADWLGIDPTIICVAYVLLNFFSAGFLGILLYITLAVLIPSGRAGSDYGYGHQNPYNRNVHNENPYAASKKQRKEVEKINDDEWSDF